MLKQLFTSIFMLCLMGLYGQSKTWTKTSASAFRYANEEDKMIMPSEYDAYVLDISQLKQDLKTTPDEASRYSGGQGLVVELPLPNGAMTSFEVYDAPVMAKGLASRYPSIKAYKGFNIEDPSMNIRFDVGPYGLHAAIHSTNGIYYIDPYARGNVDEYIVYDVKNHISEVDIDVPMCGAIDQLKDIHIDDSQTRTVEGNIPLRVYDFALACTGEWGSLRGTVELALADMVTGVNRLNQIFENECAMRIVLIEDNDKLIFFDADTDPYPNTASGGAMLSVNTSVINTRVGFPTYDLGHVYSRNCDVGGIAALGSMCNANKGAGVTCHYSNNLDFMAASVTSHEIGHQMSAQHTFNNCYGNESFGNGFEPGSGSTIMSYGGLCSPPGQVNQNVQNGSDDYYHVASLQQIYNHLRVTTSDDCADIIETNNMEPEITMDFPLGIHIPENTYFMLEGSATDANDDNLTYTWEQFNSIGNAVSLGAPTPTAPRFRSLPPTSSPVRYFPSPDNILNGSFDRTEVLPEGNTKLDFVFTVRDNNPEAGTAVWEKIFINSTAMSSQFQVTSQSTSTTNAKVGDEMIVTWDVANTDQEPINAKFVDVYFYRGENEFDLYTMTKLASRVPNNGSTKVYVPNELTTRGRVIVKASDNYFFDLNSRFIRVTEPDEPSVYFTTSPAIQSVCLPVLPSVEIATESLAGLEGDISFEILGLPTGVEATFSPSTVEVGETTTVTMDFNGAPETASYDVTLRAIAEGVDTFDRDILLNVIDTDHSALEPIAPEDGVAGINLSPTFNWLPSINAESYNIEVSTSPAFGNDIVIRTTEEVDTFFKPLDLLEKSTVYYWRVIPINGCGEGQPTKIQAFATEALACSEFITEDDELPIPISQSGLPTIEANIEVENEGSVADLNITEFRGEHNRNKDLVVSLISPEGTEVVLFSKICEQKDFNCQFDDDSNSAVKCPLNNLSIYRPIEKLNQFNGESMTGTWTLVVDDTKAGNGGELQGFKLEICGNQVLDNPFLTKNEFALLPWGDEFVITNNSLQAEDDNNTADQLIFTIVELPSKGTLEYEGNTVSVGDQFSQTDIDNNKLQYIAGEEDYVTFFSFTVIDGEGGWVGITNFDIEVSSSVSTFDEAISNDIKIYPVPASEYVTVNMNKTSEDFTNYTIVDIQGKTVAQSKIGLSKILTVNTSDLAPGVYIINLNSESYSIPKKLIIH